MTQCTRTFSILALLLLISCSEQMTTTQKDALAGTALGAGLGAIIGSQSGKAGVGTAIGAAAGALAGGALGGSMEANEKRLQEQQARIKAQEKQLEENRRLIRELKRRGADARLSDRGVVVNFPDVLFRFNSASLTKDAYRQTAEMAEVLKTIPNRRIFVEGHTDSTGSLAYNQHLSEDRAWAVADALVKEGVEKRRIFIKGFGETDPIASNATATGRRRNRRVEIIISNQ